MKHPFFTVFLVAMFLLPLALHAQPSHSLRQDRLTATVAAQTAAAADTYWSTPDAYGTPRIIKLARQGDVKTLLNLANYPLSGQFLLATDVYGNNLFHVAKNADTIHAVSSLLRHFYGAKALQKITQLANAANQLGERPLNAQINAAHADTFRPLYAYTTLKQKNDTARSQLARLRGSDERLFVQHQNIYCQDIINASSANGVTLLQAAQAQVPYHPQMAAVAAKISQVIPCLVQD